MNVSLKHKLKNTVCSESASGANNEITSSFIMLLWFICLQVTSYEYDYWNVSEL